MPSTTVASNSNTSFSGSGYTITLGDYVTITLNGSNNVVIGGQHDTVVDNGSGDTIALGNSATLFLIGATDSASTGANSTAVVNGVQDTVVIGTGSYGVLQGTSDTGTATGTGSFNLAGSNQTATVASGGYIGVVSGSGQVAYVNNGTVLTLNNVGVTVVGSGNQVVGAANSVYNVNGSNNTVTEGTGSFANLNGNNDTATATGTGGFNVDGANDTATVADGAYVGVIVGSTNAVVNDSHGTVVTNNNVSLTLYGTGTQLYGGGASSYTVVGTGNNATLAGGDALVVSGGGNTVEAGAGNTVSLLATGGSFDRVLSTGGATVNLGDGVQANLFGGASTVNLGRKDTFGAYGGGNAIHTTETDLVVIGATAGQFDEVSGDNDVQGELTADGRGTGIVVQDNAQVNLHGNGDAVTLGTGDSLGAYGGGNEIDTGTGNLLVIGATGVVADTVYSNGDLAGGVTANGQQTGILLNNGAQAEVYGSSNTLVLGTGDSLGAHGGYNQITTGAGNIVAIDGTGDHADNVFGSGDAAGGTTSNGQPTGIGLSGASEAYLYGSNDFVTLTGGGNTLGLLGGGTGVTVQGDGSTVTASDGSAFTVIGSSDQVNTGTGVSATVQGTGDTVNLNGAGSVAGVFNTGAGTNVVRENGAGDGINVQNQAGGATEVQFDGTGGYAGLLGGSGYGVTGNGGTVATWYNTAFNVSGSGDTVYTAAGDTAAVAGGGNTVMAGPGVAVVVGGTNGNADNIYANGDTAVAGVTTPGGLPAGIVALDNTQVTVVGSGNTAVVGNNGYLGVVGNGNAAIAGANSALVVNGNSNQTQSLSGGSATFAGTGNSAALNGTTLYSADGNPITFTGTPTAQGNVAAAVAQSPEVADDIDELYLEVLGRSVDPQGLTSAQTTLTMGGSFQDIRTVLATSQEAQNDLARTLASVGADPATPAAMAGFEKVLSADYAAPITLYSQEGQVLAKTDVPNLLAELPVLETLDNGRTLSLGLPDGSTLSFKDTSHLTEFLYAVAVQKSQGGQLVTDAFKEDLNWLNQVGQPMLNAADEFQDLASYNTAHGNADQAKLASVAAQLALNIAAEVPGARADMTEKVSVGGHETAVTVYAGASDTSGARFHDIDPGILGIVETVGVAVLNIAAVIQPELAPLAIAADAAVAGQDFANGDVVGGILSLAAAAGGFEKAIGNVFASTIINTATAAVGGVYGAVQSAENGDPLGILAGTLEAAAAAASGYSAFQPEPANPLAFPEPGVPVDPLTGLSDPGLKSFTAEIGSALGTASVALTTADAFKNGDVASGLISSLGAFINNIASDYELSQQESDSRYVDLKFGDQPNDDGTYEVADDGKRVDVKFLRALGLIGTDAHNTLGDYAETQAEISLKTLYPNATILYNTEYGGLFGGDRPDFVVNLGDNSPLLVIELKPASQAALGAKQLADDLKVANADARAHGLPDVAIAGDPKILFSGYESIVLTTQPYKLLPGSGYMYTGSDRAGVALYSPLDRPSSVSKAFQYLFSKPPEFFPVTPTGPMLVPVV